MEGWDVENDEGRTKSIVDDWVGIVEEDVIGGVLRDVVGNKVERYLETKWDVEDAAIMEDWIGSLGTSVGGKSR